jgi:S1-C subfamily serine protease
VYAWTHFVERPEREVHSVVLPLQDLSERGEGVELYPLQFGATLVEVAPGSPAEEAGLQVGDRIIAVDGQRLGLDGDLADLLGQYRPRDRVTLLIQRAAEDPFEVRVRLGENPDNEDAAYLGVRYVPSSPLQSPRWKELLPREFEELDKEFSPAPETESSQGALVIEVLEDGPAWAAGLEEGDVITAVDGKPMDGPQAVSEAISRYQPGDRVVLTVYQPWGEKEREVKVRLAEHPDEKGRAYLGVRLARFSGDEGLE